MDKEIMLYQYTDLSALVEGIVRRNEKTIYLRATNCASLNDPDEMMEGLRHIKVNIGMNSSDESDKLPLIDITINMNDTYSRENLYDGLRQQTYITSLSYERDSLPMWEMYGRRGHGICIGFHGEVLANDNVVKGDCTYLHDLSKTEDNFRRIIDRYMKCNKSKFGPKEVYRLLSAFIKSDTYAYEREVRMVLMNPEEKELNFRVSEGIVKGYYDIPFDQQALKEIWIGPATENPVDTAKSIKCYLETACPDRTIILEEYEGRKSIEQAYEINRGIDNTIHIYYSRRCYRSTR